LKKHYLKTYSNSEASICCEMQLVVEQIEKDTAIN